MDCINRLFACATSKRSSGGGVARHAATGHTNPKVTGQGVSDDLETQTLSQSRSSSSGQVLASPKSTANNHMCSRHCSTLKFTVEDIVKCLIPIVLGLGLGIVLIWSFVNSDQSNS